MGKKNTMDQILKPLALLMLLCITISYAADNLLQNPDFENVTVNGTSRLSRLDRTSSNIPGWSFYGTVYYVTSDNDSSSFPSRGGHAIQLAENGIINQTFKIRGTEVMEYVLSFNIAALNQDCASDYNRTIAVNMTAYLASVLESEVLHSERSKVFYYYGRDFSRRLWESNAFYFGHLTNRDYVNLEIKSMTDDHNVTSNCWPLVDDFIIQRNHVYRWYNGNSLANGDFELGPSFSKNSYEGILLNQEQEQEQETLNYFNLQEWTILGTIRYIDSKHYRVPQGKAAIELLSESGGPSGIQIDLYLAPTYTLNFTMGDANDSCVGDFLLYLEIRQNVQNFTMISYGTGYLEIGQNVQNFTMSSHGTGSAFHHSITIKGEPSNTTSTIRFYTLNETRTSDGVLCGPVLDEIGIFDSYGESVDSGVLLEMVGMHIFVVVAALSYFILLD